MKLLTFASGYLQPCSLTDNNQFYAHVFGKQNLLEGYIFFTNYSRKRTMDGFDVTISDVQGQMAKRRYTAAAFKRTVLCLKSYFFLVHRKLTQICRCSK